MPPRPATPISLFSARARTYTGPSAYEESEYLYLDRSARAYAVEVRSTLDSWFCALPEYARTSLRNSFASSRTPVHRGALLELYLHDMFRRLDVEIDLDIGREDPAHRRPDFLLEPDGARTWVEATAVLGADVFAESARRRVQQLYDLLNRCRDRRFLLHVAIEEVGSATLGRKQVLDPLERWLAGRDPVELRQAIDRGDEPPECRLTSGGWVIAIEATPVRADMPLRPDERLVGSSLEGVATLDDARPLRGSLKHKATHYGALDAPYVVAALCVGTFVTDHDIEAALLGDIAYARDPQRIGLMRVRQPRMGSGMGLASRSTRAFRRSPRSRSCPQPASRPSSRPSGTTRGPSARSGLSCHGDRRRSRLTAGSRRTTRREPQQTSSASRLTGPARICKPFGGVRVSDRTIGGSARTSMSSAIPSWKVSFVVRPAGRPRPDRDVVRHAAGIEADAGAGCGPASSSTIGGHA